MAAYNWESGRRRSNQLYMLGGRVWKGLMIMEYYQVMVRSSNARLTRHIHIAAQAAALRRDKKRFQM